MSRFLSARRSEEASNQQLASLLSLILAKSFHPTGKELAAHLISTLSAASALESEERDGPPCRLNEWVAPEGQ